MNGVQGAPGPDVVLEVIAQNEVGGYSEGRDALKS